MARALAWMVAPVVLVAGASAALAADTVDGTKLKVGAVVNGPATVTGVEKDDQVLLRPGAVLVCLEPDTEGSGASQVKTLHLFLKKGGADARVGFLTRLSTPSFYAFPEKQGVRAEFYVETFSAELGYARAKKGSGLLRVVDTVRGAEIHLNEEQGVTLSAPKTGKITFTTDPYNAFERGLVRVYYPLASGLVIDLKVPKATTGTVGPAERAGETRIENLISSWKNGSIRIVTVLGGAVVKEAGLGPGVHANVTESGDIEIGFVKVDFKAVNAAISLTSEFASAAVSLFFRP